MAEQVLCRIEDIPDGGARGFLPTRRRDRVFAVRRGERVFVYLNLCPHDWIGLELMKDKFLTGDGETILCYGHGAHFEVETGLCTAGPCLGDRLRRVPYRIVDGEILIPELPPEPGRP